MTQDKTKALSIAQEQLEKNNIGDAIRILQSYISDIDPLFLPIGDLIDIVTEIYTRSRDYDIAKSVYDLALNFNQQNDDRWLKIKAYNGLASVAFYTGNFLSALEFLNNAKLLCSSRKFEVYYCGNYARIAIKLGKFDDAIANLNKAIEGARIESNELSQLRNMLSLAYAHGLNNNPGRGIAILETEIDSQTLIQNKWETIIFYEYLGHLQLLKYLESRENDNLLNKACANLHKGLELAEDFGPNASGAGQTCRMLAEVYLYSEDYAKANEYAQRAFRISTKINERYELGILHWIFARLAEHEGDYERAETNLALSKKILTEIGAAYELKRLHSTAPVLQEA